MRIFVLSYVLLWYWSILPEPLRVTSQAPGNIEIVHRDSKVYGANIGPTWVLSAPDGPHVGPMNLVIRAVLVKQPSSMFVICLKDPPKPDNNDDVIKWKHFPRYWSFVWGIHRSPVTRNFDVFFDLRQNKLLSTQSWGWWFETPSHPLWRHRNDFQNNQNTTKTYA